MPEKVLPGPVSPDCPVREAVCVHTRKVYDSCRDKDCITDLRVLPSAGSQQILEEATSLKCRGAELLWVQLDVESVPFQRGFYTVDARFYYRITADAFRGTCRPQEVYGLAVFDKRVILFGSEGNARIYSSKTALGSMDPPSLMQNNLPTAVCEVVEPLCLGTHLCEAGACTPCCSCCEPTQIPDVICRCFDEDLIAPANGKRWTVTLGQFSIMRLERDSQLIMPAYDFCVPEKECVSGGESDPCELFERINFPVDEFFPPAERELSGDVCWKDLKE